MLYRLLRPILFLFEPETAHHITFTLLTILFKLKLIRTKKITKPLTVMGIDFPNPVGLAAGLDKNGEYIDALAALGFGFIEIGTVTPRPQPGNPKPRLFRLTQAEALINRLGFNNKGVDYLIEKVKAANYRGILGINIGKNFDTSLEKAVDDYIFCMRRIYPYASYITVNISSPNTPGLRQLQFGHYLDQLLETLKNEQTQLSLSHHKYVPLVIKISPDLSAKELNDIAVSLLKYKIDGVIATNTTLSREKVSGLKYADEQGGLSGKPLTQKSTVVVASLNKILGGKIPIVAAGGIMSADDAKAKIVAGASLLEIYTGLIYKGPKIIAAILHQISLRVLA